MSIIARRPDQNAFIERFNRSDRTEVLNAHLFESIAELRENAAQLSLLLESLIRVILRLRF